MNGTEYQKEIKTRIVQIRLHLSLCLYVYLLTYRKQEKCIQGFGQVGDWGGGKRPLEDIVIDGR